MKFDKEYGLLGVWVVKFSLWGICELVKEYILDNIFKWKSKNIIFNIILGNCKI